MGAWSMSSRSCFAQLPRGIPFIEYVAGVVFDVGSISLFLKTL
jgi:hypothetical protein